MQELFRLEDLNFLDLLYYPNVNIEREKATFITGESGQGKSTLLKLLNSTLSPTSGKIYYQQKDMLQLDTLSYRKEVLLCGQDAFLFDDTIRGNFHTFYQYRKQQAPSDGQMQEYLKVCAADFDLDRDCTKMSGGERQRTFTAICLSFNPKVLLLDEPTAALDASNATLLLKNLKQYCNVHHMSLIVVSHDQALVLEHADVVVHLEGVR